MKKKIVQTFDATLDEVMIAREDRYKEIDKFEDLKSARELERREDDEYIYKKRESTASHYIPKQFRKYLNEDMLRWYEFSKFNKKTYVHEWRVEPAHYDKYLDVKGTNVYSEYEEEGRKKTKRVFECLLKVKAPVLGPIAERAIFEAFKKNFVKDRDAIMERVLRQRKKENNET